MPIPLILLLILWGLFVVFLLGPAIVALSTVFARRESLSFDEVIQSGRFAPAAPEMTAARASLARRGRVSVQVRASDGAELWGDYYDLHGDKTALFFHGYRAEAMLNCCVQAEAFARRGWNLLLVDQRAHGRSGGRHTLLGLAERNDVPVWAQWAAKQPGVKALAIYGVSMGAAAAAYASDRLDPELVRTLVIDCGFLSPYVQMYGDCRARHLPAGLLMPMIRLLARLRYGVDLAEPVTAALSRTEIPAFFLHGTADHTVPYEQGKKNFDACASPKIFYSVEGAGHTMCFPTDRERAEEALFGFMSPYFSTNGEGAKDQK